MSDQKPSERSLEARVAELEDKLKRLSITEEEMRAFNKVAAAMGPQPSPAEATALGTEPALAVCRICTTCRVCGGCRSCGCRMCRVVAAQPSPFGPLGLFPEDFGGLGGF